MGVGRRALIGAAILLLVVGPITAEAARTDLSVGVLGLIADGDPAVGGYADLRTRLGGRGLAGLDAELHYQPAQPAEDGWPAEEAGLFALGAVAGEIDLSATVGMAPEFALRAGARGGVGWERALGGAGELYPVLGARASVARRVGRRWAAELRITVDVLPALHAGIGIGVRLGPER